MRKICSPNLLIAAVYIGAVLFSSRAEGARIISMAPWTSLSRNSPGHNYAAQGYVVFTLKNLSSHVQHVTVRADDEKVRVTLQAANIVGISGWTVHPTLTYIIFKEYFPTALETVVTVPANGVVKGTAAGFYCLFKVAANPGQCARTLTQVGGYSFDMNATDPLGQNYIKVGKIEHDFVLTFTVAEDRGALLGYVKGEALIVTNGNSEPTQSDVSVELNGGRPF